MNRIIHHVIACGAVLLLAMEAARPMAAPAETNPNAATLAGDNAAFACDLYGQLDSREGNLFFSPYSISSCLAMTSAGARGATADQMAKSLHLSLASDALHPAFASLAQSLVNHTTPAQKPAGPDAPRITLRIANNLFPQRGATLLPEFLNIAKTHYGAAVSPLDYTSQAEAARTTINEWVEQQTEQKIKDLIPAGTLDAKTRLVLVNAVYFYGSWLTPFDPKLTRDQPFTVTLDKVVPKPLMTMRNKRFGYAETDALQVLQMNYVGSGLSMIVLLPKAKDGLTALEKDLSAEHIKTWREALHETAVDVYFPKFRMDDSFQLNAPLTALGMRDAFDPASADFSGMDGKRDLFISAVMHKSFVDVSEQGTEAAAATGAVISLTAARPGSKPIFHADHPFVFLIQDNATGAILFLGRVLNPASGGN